MQQWNKDEVGNGLIKSMILLTIHAYHNVAKIMKIGKQKGDWQRAGRRKPDQVPQYRDIATVSRKSAVRPGATQGVEMSPTEMHGLCPRARYAVPG
jgi:hypothetical protein